MHLGDHVLPIDDDLLAPRRTQRHMQHRAILGDVDLVATEHRIDALAQPRLLRQFEQQLDGLRGDAMLRVVEVETDLLERELIRAMRIFGEQRAQMQCCGFFRNARPVL